MPSGCGAFVDREEVLQTLVSNGEKINTGLGAKDIEDYLSLISWFHSSNDKASFDLDFQRRFRRFYRLDMAGLTLDFLAEYFRLLGTLPRRAKVDLAGICKALQPFKNRQNHETLQFSFCTKLAATLNPDYPIYDACVGRVFQFAAPPPPMPYNGRVQCCLTFYNHLRSTINWLAASPDIASIVPPQLQESENWAALSPTKQIDFLIWAAGKP
jgi:hypothetical protein